MPLYTDGVEKSTRMPALVKNYTESLTRVIWEVVATVESLPHQYILINCKDRKKIAKNEF